MKKSKISFKEFLEIESKLEIKIGRIVKAERIPKKDKLLRLEISFDDLVPEDVKVCVTNLGEFHEPEVFMNELCPFITNLEPSKLGGVVSEVMIMPSQYDGIVEFGLEMFSAGGKLL